MPARRQKLKPVETLLKVILQKMGKKCKDKDFLKARKQLEKQEKKKQEEAL